MLISADGKRNAIIGLSPVPQGRGLVVLPVAEVWRANLAAHLAGGPARSALAQWLCLNHPAELRTAGKSFVPTLTTFFGIVIRMYYDHPPTHFHAIYGEYEAKIGCEALELIEGNLPAEPPDWFSTGRNFVQQELRDNWVRCQEHNVLNAIKLLE
jgi:hypothetical protein